MIREPRCPWSRLAPATVRFRENNLCAWIRQPANTWSNLAYVIVGLWLLVQPPARAGGALALIPITAVLVGIGSFLYHASFSLLFQTFDLGAMYLFSCLLLALDVRRLLPLSDWAFYGLYLGLFGVSLAAFLRIRRQAGFLIFGLHIVLLTVLEGVLALAGRGAGDYRPFLAIFAVLIAALIPWILDYRGLGFHPDNHLIQGHALWHVISSLCFIFVFRYYSLIVLD